MPLNFDGDIFDVIRIISPLPQIGIELGTPLKAKITDDTFYVKNRSEWIILNPETFCVYNIDNLHLINNNNTQQIIDNKQTIRDLMKKQKKHKTQFTMIYIGNSGIFKHGEEVGFKHVYNNGLFNEHNYQLWVTPYEYMSLNDHNIKEKLKYITFEERMYQLGITVGLKNKETIMKTKCVPKSYSFGSLSPSDVNYGKIAEDLTKDNPIALIEKTVGDQVVKLMCVSFDFINKAKGKEIKVPTKKYGKFSGMLIYTINKDSDISKWVEWAKNVRSAKWVNGEKATYKVTVLDIK